MWWILHFLNIMRMFMHIFCTFLWTILYSSVWCFKLFSTMWIFTYLNHNYFYLYFTEVMSVTSILFTIIIQNSEYKKTIGGHLWSWNGWGAGYSPRSVRFRGWCFRDILCSIHHSPCEIFSWIALTYHIITIPQSLNTFNYTITQEPKMKKKWKYFFLMMSIIALMMSIITLMIFF